MSFPIEKLCKIFKNKKLSFSQKLNHINKYRKKKLFEKVMNYFKIYSEYSVQERKGNVKLALEILKLCKKYKIEDSLEEKKYRSPKKQFPDVLIDIINKKANTKHIKDWIPKHKLKRTGLLENKQANTFILGEYIKGNITKKDMKVISRNPAAKKILELEYKKNQGKNFKWRDICLNPALQNILESEYKKDGGKKFDWDFLSRNSAAINIIRNEMKKNNFGKIVLYSLLLYNEEIEDLLLSIYENDPNSNLLIWVYMSSNPSLKKILELEYKRNGGLHFNWNMLYTNPAAIEIIKQELENNLDSVRWNMLSLNKKVWEIVKDDYEYFRNFLSKKHLSSNTGAEKILEIEYKRNGLKGFDKVQLSGNPAAINILRDDIENNGEKIVQYSEFSENPAIFNTEETRKILYNLNW